MSKSTSIGSPSPPLVRGKAEIVGKHHACGQNTLEDEDLLLGVEGKFVSALSRRLDDDLEEVVLLVQRRQLVGSASDFTEFLSWRGHVLQEIKGAQRVSALRARIVIRIVTLACWLSCCVADGSGDLEAAGGSVHLTGHVT